MAETASKVLYFIAVLTIQFFFFYTTATQANNNQYWLYISEKNYLIKKACLL